ncbi:aminodeoxychorismate/anthranilate synthase component II [Bacteroidia bacterium]|nr:aminodeoxychorismate/anthranilate synthase component II [Bacteroidia bacterium]
MRLLIIDNYDSFTYNLVHLVRRLGYSDVEVHRNDKIAIEEVAQFDKIILSPGPGVPSEAGILLDVIKTYASSKSILGVCLGEQAIGEAFGGTLLNLPNVYHGVATKVYFENDDYLFDGLPSPQMVGRYHSWVVSRQNFPDCLKITAVDDSGMVMALAHVRYDVHGVQFHPESVLTPAGEQIVANFLKK